MKQRICSTLLALALLLSGCAASEQVQVLNAELESSQEEAAALPPLAFDEVMQLARENHAYLFTPMDETYVERIQSAYENLLDPQRDRETAATIRALGEQPHRATEVLTPEQAREDAAFLMDYLESCYAGYAVLGGPETFQPLRTELLAAVDSLGEEIPYDDLVQTFRAVLYPVIPDMHFTVDWVHEDGRLPLYKVASHSFISSSAAYLDADNGAVLNRVLVDGTAYEPEALLRPWLEPDGTLVYRLLLECNEDAVVELLFGEEAYAATLQPLETQLPQEESGQLWDLTETDGIPVLHCRSFMPTMEEDSSSLEAFVQTADSLRDAPYLIVDLRGNAGGMAYYGSEWLGGLTGMDPGYFMSNGVLVTLYSETALAMYPEYYGNWYYEDCEALRNQGAFPGYEVSSDLQRRDPVPSSQTILVLADRTTGSAAEYFITYLSMLENTVIIGSPTKGQFHFGLNVWMNLPQSGININSGMNLYLPPDLEVRDGIGFFPDIWCDSDCALEAALAFINALENE